MYLKNKRWIMAVLLIMAVMITIIRPGTLSAAETENAMIDPDDDTVELQYNDHADSGAMVLGNIGFQSMISNMNKKAVYSAVAKNENVAKVVRNKWNNYEDKDLIVATGVGTTTVSVFEKVGKAAKTKIGTIKVKVTKSTMEEICQESFNNNVKYIELLWLKLNLRKDLKSIDVGKRFDKRILNPSDRSVHIKKSEYKIAYKIRDDKVAEISKEGVLKGLKAGETSLKIRIKFSDKSVFDCDSRVKVTDSILKKEGKYSLKNIRKEIIGLDTPVELEDGTKVPMINFDNAATTPAFQCVSDEIAKQMEMYGSIHRGSSQKSNYSTQVYNDTRDKVIEFVGADPETYTCFYVNSTTDGLNKLASALIEKKSDLVLTTRIEHHANDLSWRHRCKVIYAEVDKKGRVDYGEIEEKLKENKGKVKYVSVTAASNVTGYVTDVHRVAKMAHKYGAKIIVDGAQIVAHRKFSMLGDTPEENIDFLAFSAHKMYSPYGGGAVVGLASVLNKHMPTFYGGGTIKVVGDNWEVYKQAPEVYEAGSPNYPAVVGLGKAIEVLNDIGFDSIQAHEKQLNRKLMDGLAKLDHVIIYGDSDNIDDRVGVVTFNFSDINSLLLSEKMNALGGIATRRGAFCAHPYVWRMMGVSDQEAKDFENCTDAKTPGMIRVSFGIYNTEEEVDRMLKLMPKAMKVSKKLQKKGEVEYVEEY